MCRSDGIQVADLNRPVPLTGAEWGAGDFGNGMQGDISLGNFRKPMDEDLAQLGSGVSKVVCAVVGFARKVAEVEERQAASAAELPTYKKLDVTIEEMKRVKELCSAALAGGRTSGDPILGPAPVKHPNQ